MAQLMKYEPDLKRGSRWRYYAPLPEVKANLLYPQEAGDFLAGPGYFEAREGLDSYLLQMTTGGCGMLRYGGNQYQVPMGSFFLIDCRQRQEYRTEAETGCWRAERVYFHGPAAAFYYDAFLRRTNGSPVAELGEDRDAYPLLDRLLGLDTAPQMEMDLEASLLLTQILTRCIRAVGQPIQRRMPPLIQEIRAYLTANYARKLTLQELSDRFGLSPCYLQRVFKRWVGQSPAEYLIRLRMSRAKELIRATGMSISEISYAVGIENVGYFTQRFRRQEGQTPQQYRREMMLMPSGGADREPTVL